MEKKMDNLVTEMNMSSSRVGRTQSIPTNVSHWAHFDAENCIFSHLFRAIQTIRLSSPEHVKHLCGWDKCSAGSVRFVTSQRSTEHNLVVCMCFHSENELLSLNLFIYRLNTVIFLFCQCEFLHASFKSESPASYLLQSVELPDESALTAPATACGHGTFSFQRNRHGEEKKLLRTVWYSLQLVALGAVAFSHAVL